MDVANRPNHMLLCSVGGRLWVALFWQLLCWITPHNIVPIECGGKYLYSTTHNTDHRDGQTTGLKKIGREFKIK